ncbi:MAG TPA: M50 family metallopeptidase [Candidatus Paceibacterota bacterium]|nr:M50 family metallopeptidase [Candidatus Paceibacterota bacterium]
MAIALAFFFLLLAMVLHELGHALEMRAAGIRIERLGIGVPLPPRILIRSNCLRRFFGARFRIMLSPWLLGAFVKPYGDQGIETMGISRRSELAIYGAGPIANIALMFLFSGVSLLLLYDPASYVQTTYFFRIALEGYVWIIALGFFAAALATWWFRRWISTYLLLPLGLAMLAFTISVFANMTFSEATQSSGGIVLISEIASESQTIAGAVRFGAIINFALGAMNLLPILPLDGGRIMSVFVRSIAPRAEVMVQKFGIIAFAALIVFCLYADGLRLVGYFTG